MVSPPSTAQEDIMRSKLRANLTYANVISTLCLFLLVAGGTAFAAGRLGNNTVGTKQLKRNAVTTSKIKDGAVSSTKLSQSAVSALKGPAGPPGAPGAAGKQGPSGTVLAYALVESDGGVDPGGSKGITAADVSLDATGTYCFKNIPAGTKTIVATANGEFENNDEADHFVSVAFIPDDLTVNWTGCTESELPVRVTTYDQSAGGRGDSAFMIWFED
jgi:hypothetical protein